MLSDPVILAVIAGAVTTFATVTAAVVSVATLLVGRKTQASAASTEHAMVELKTNTNSIKDALVKVTAESEHAKGLKQGREESGSALTGPAGKTGPQGEKGEKGDTGGQSSG